MLRTAPFFAEKERLQLSLGRGLQPPVFKAEGLFLCEHGEDVYKRQVFLQGECAFYCVGLWDFPTCTETMGDNFAWRLYTSRGV